MNNLSMVDEPETRSESDHDVRVPGGSDSQPKGCFRVRTPSFEGPIDLLLYLIKKNELDIHEISLSQITMEYLEYVEVMKLVDLESAGDFITVAAALLKIKAKSLFENKEDIGEGLEVVTTKDQLIRYLMEFEKLGGIAELLAKMEQERLGVFPRGGERSRILDSIKDETQEPDYMLFDLFTVLREVLKNAPKTETHDVELLNVTSEMKQREILRVLSQKGQIDFIGLVSDQPRLIIVVTFIAMLELIKAGKIGIRQSRQFGQIIIYAKETGEFENN